MRKLSLGAVLHTFLTSNASVTHKNRVVTRVTQFLGGIRVRARVYLVDKSKIIFMFAFALQTLRNLRNCVTTPFFCVTDEQFTLFLRN